MWFVDASVLLAREDADDAQHDAAVRLLAGQEPLAIAGDGGLVRVEGTLLAEAVALADGEGLSVYDAGYVVGAARAGAQLVSCDVRDLVSRGLAVIPEQALP